MTEEKKKRMAWWKWILLAIYVPFALLGIIYASFELFFRLGRDTFYELINFNLIRQETMKVIQKNNEKKADE